jgi:hypothetical protein
VNEFDAMPEMKEGLLAAVNENRTLEGLEPQVLSKAEQPKGIDLSSGGLYVRPSACPPGKPCREFRLKEK